MKRNRLFAAADKRYNCNYNPAMRIGIDCRLPTYRMGGISQYVLYLLPALANLDNENDYILFHSRKEQRDFVPETAVLWRRRDLWTPPHNRFERYSLPLELAPHGLDVFHSPDFIPPASGAMRRVITIHDLTFLHYPELLTNESRRYYNDQIQWAAETADAIAVDSFATRQDVIELLSVPPQKVTAVHLAANPLYSQDVSQDEITAVLQRHNLAPGFLLSVGTLEPRKNLPFLFQVYARLRREKNFKAPLVLVGKHGWLYEEIYQAIARLDLEPYVMHIDSLTDKELRALYYAAAALVTPSLYEGFGLPALEAQHCGCPAVVSNRGSLPEIVGEQGLIISLEDEDGWVNSLAEVSADEALRRDVIKNGRQQAAGFQWAKTAEQTLSLYLGSNQAA